MARTNCFILSKLLSTLLLVGCRLPLFSQTYNSVVISEIMADPTPVVGLPDAEYLELHNTTSQAISLRGWRLNIGETVTLLPDSVLAPGGFIILCARTRVALLAPLGRVVGVTPFSLANAGASLVLRNSRGTLVHAVAYRDSWWPADRRGGGYALEMVDSANPCAEAPNWKVATAPAGGTPGQVNSVRAANPDTRPPRAERTEIVGDSQINVYFDERLDSLASTRSGTYELKGRGIRRVTIETPAFRVLSLFLDAPLVAGQRYELTIRNISDCTGNTLREATFTLGLPVKADSGDVVLNEILYDPRTGGVEFVEIYNRTSNYISLRNWAVGNIRNGVPATFRILSTSDLLLAPNDFVAFSTRSETLLAHYPTEKKRTLVEVPSLPAFTNGSGGVVLRDAAGKVFDVFEYDDRFHSPLLTATKGVSLERIYPERRGNDPQNWQSAASVVGYATPGYPNSQGVGAAPADLFVVEPEAFTPDGDGIDDVATVRYVASGTNRLTTIRVFDAQGRLVRNLVQNQTLGTNGAVEWDGSDEQGNPVRMGYYLFLIDSFDSAGNQHHFKKRVVVVRR